MNKNLVTVVMAVYNSAKYLDISIGSVLKQTYIDWKLICVDDGSTDNSLDILRKYEREDERIIVLAKQNGGPASARAEAYKIVKTPYVMSLDSDDELDTSFLEVVLNRALESNADAVAPNLLIEQPDGHFMNWNNYYKLDPKTFVTTGMDAFARTFIGATMHGVNLWRTELIKKYAIGENAQFNRLNEDEYIQRLLFLASKSVVLADTNYYYNDNNTSITKKFRINHLGYLITCRKYIELIHIHHIPTDIASTIREFYMRNVIALQIKYYKYANCLCRHEKELVRKTIKAAYYDALQYKEDIKFAEKGLPWLHRLVTINGYVLFGLSCFIFSKFKK